MAGPAVHFDPTVPRQQQLPEYLDNSILIYEWSRHWIKQVKLDADGNVLKINPFLSTYQFDRPMDMELGADGALYLLEWGSSFRGGNSDSQLLRITYRHPEIEMPKPPGDFNDDTLVDADDIDLLCGGIRTGSTDTQFDLSGDGVVNAEDLRVLVEDLLETSLGDANLDGAFNSSDLVIVFQAGEYEDAVEGNSSWRTGDWDCDGEFLTSDLVVAFQAGAYSAAALRTSLPTNAQIAAASELVFQAAMQVEQPYQTETAPVRRLVPAPRRPAALPLGGSNAYSAHRDAAVERVFSDPSVTRGLSVETQRSMIPKAIEELSIAIAAGLRVC